MGLFGRQVGHSPVVLTGVTCTCTERVHVSYFRFIDFALATDMWLLLPEEAELM